MKKYKVRVKAIEINDSEECQLTFSPCDRTFICNKEYFLGIDDQDKPVVTLNLTFNGQKNPLFDFISAHSKETFVIGIDEIKKKKPTDKTENQMKNSNYVLKSVELIYD